MTRTLFALALALAVGPASASSSPDPLDDDAVAAAPKSKDPLPERTGPRDLGDDPIEDFDLLDTPDRPSPMLGEFQDLDDTPARPGTPAQRKTASAPAPTGPGPVALDVAGKQPLADNYPLTVLNVDRDAVVVELPILLARSRVAIDKPFSITVEVSADDTRVSRVTQIIDPESLAEFGPTFAFMKIMAPVLEKDGRITVKVSRANPDGSQPVELFTRSTPYALP
jgi:hypothetical protein